MCFINLFCRLFFFFFLHLQTVRLWDVNELFTCASTFVPLNSSNAWISITGEKIDVYIRCVWDFWSLTSWNLFQILLLNGKSCECWKGVISSEQLRGRWLNQILSSRTRSPKALKSVGQVPPCEDLMCGQLWHFSFFRKWMLNLTKRVPLNGLNIYVVRP